MKIKNVKNSEENKICSILHGVEYSSYLMNSQEKVLYHRGAILDFKSIKGITLIALAISRKCVRYEERAWKPCERREKERKV